MTIGELALWRALYAAAWFQSSGGPSGVRDDVEHARWCARQANRGVAALGLVHDEVMKHQGASDLTEVLG